MAASSPGPSVRKKSLCITQATGAPPNTGQMPAGPRPRSSLAAGLLAPGGCAPRPAVTGLLPAVGERVAVAGCGTSWFIAQSYAAAREASGQGETDAFAASELPAVRLRYDRVVVLCRSGTTTEILHVLARIGGAQPTVAITAVPDTPVAAAADAVIVLDFCQTRSRSCRPGSPRRNSRCCSLHLFGTDLGGGGGGRRAGARRAAAAGAGRRPPVHLPRQPAGPAASPVRRRPSCASRPVPGPRRTRRWSSGTARSR